VERVLGKQPIRRLSRGWYDNIKIGFGETSGDNAKLIDLCFNVAIPYKQLGYRNQNLEQTVTLIL
jgi:hypothetical protein